MAHIPVIVNVVTTTKPMKMDERPSDGVLFPPLPLKPADIDFYLSRDVFIRATNWSAASIDTFLCDVAGFGKSPRHGVDVQRVEKVWIPFFGDEKKQKGSWKQEVTFKSILFLTCPPTFSSPLIRVVVSSVHPMTFQRRLFDSPLTTVRATPQSEFPGVGQWCQVRIASEHCVEHDQAGPTRSRMGWTST